MKKETKSKKRDIKQKESNRKKQNKTHISKAVTLSFDKEHGCFVDENDNYILMCRTHGINLFGLKDDEQLVYMNAFSTIFNDNIGEGQIFSVDIPADVQGYINDYNYIKSTLNVEGNKSDYIRYGILNDASDRLKDTAVTRELVDRCFIIILKDKNFSRLERRINEIISSLGNYQRTYRLNTQEMVDVVYNYYNPEHSVFVNSKNYQEKYGLMDAIYPDYIGFYDQGFHQSIELNGLYCKTKWLSSFDREPVLAQLCYIATFPMIDFSLHWSPAPADSIRKDINKTIKNLNKDYGNAKEASDVANIRKELEKNDILIDQLVREQEYPLYFSCSVRITGETPEILKKRCEMVEKYCANFHIRLRDGVYQPLEMFNLTAPTCTNMVENYMLETTADTMAYMYPFVFEALYDSTSEVDDDGNTLFRYPPVYIGNTINTNGVIFYDNFVRKDDRSNSNEFIVGASGMGKTFFIMWLMKQRYALGYKQYIVDVEGRELHRFVHALGGENINCSFGDRGRINPLQIRFSIPDSEYNTDKIPLDSIKPLAEHIRFLRSFFKAYKGDNEDIRTLHDNTIEKALLNIYSNIGVTLDTTAQEIVDRFKNEDYPILKDLYDELCKMEEKAVKDDVKDEIKRIKECIVFIEPLATGADSVIFNGHTNVDLSNNLTCFNVSGLQDNTANKVLRTQYFNIMSFIWTEIISNTTAQRHQIYADEFSVIMDSRFPDIMMYFENISRRIRKRNGGLTTATQQINDVLKDSVKDHGEAIIENSTYQFFFSVGVKGMEFFKKTNIISPSEMEFIQFAGIGDCYAKFGSQIAMRTHIMLPEEEMKFLESFKK